MQASQKGPCEASRPHWMKIPLLTTGLMIGSLKIPPLCQIPISAGGSGAPRIKGPVRLGFGKTSLPVPAFLVNREVGAGIRRAQKTVGRFSAAKKAVHHFVVRKLPQTGEPLALEHIAAGLDLPLEKVARLVTELEQAKTFLFRKNSDRIDWAYPVTVDETPHKVTFSSGEQINAA